MYWLKLIYLRCSSNKSDDDDSLMPTNFSKRGPSTKRKPSADQQAFNEDEPQKPIYQPDELPDENELLEDDHLDDLAVKPQLIPVYLLYY